MLGVNVPSKLHTCMAAQLLRPLCAVTRTLCAIKFCQNRTDVSMPGQLGSLTQTWKVEQRDTSLAQSLQT